MEVVNFVVGLLAIGLFGFATQRGGACAVASIVEVVTEHKPGRLLALLETSILVGGGLGVLSTMDVLATVPGGYVARATTIFGGVVMGIGALYNRSCAIGTIARIGSGQLAYLATPLGFFLGSLGAYRITAPEPLTQDGVSLIGPIWLGVACIAILMFRLLTNGWRIWRTGSGPLPYFWSPYLATSIGGMAFLVAFMTVGGWTYTETIGEIARGRDVDALQECLLFGALTVGAVLGGWTVGLRPKAPRGGRLWRCFIGGCLMGIGAALIPGGSDALILVGMPLLWPYAWLAFASMCATIYITIRLR